MTSAQWLAHKRMIEYSEYEMAGAFEEAIKTSSIRGLPSFMLIMREVPCQQGIPDFVALTSATFISEHDFSNLSSTECSSIVLSLLKHKAGRKRQYIKEKSNISDATLNRVLKELQNNGLICEKDGLYYLSMNSVTINDNVWAFELKLSNWKRAMFQALQNKAFANYSVVVFPFEREKVLQQNISLFDSLNVGVLLFESKTKKSKWLKRPRKEKSISKWQTLFLLGKVAKQHSQSIDLGIPLEHYHD